jgi:hypothetical protein
MGVQWLSGSQPVDFSDARPPQPYRPRHATAPRSRRPHPSPAHRSGLVAARSGPITASGKRPLLGLPQALPRRYYAPDPGALRQLLIARLVVVLRRN